MARQSGSPLSTLRVGSARPLGAPSLPLPTAVRVSRQDTGSHNPCSQDVDGGETPGHPQRRTCFSPLRPLAPTRTFAGGSQVSPPSPPLALTTRRPRGWQERATPLSAPRSAGRLLWRTTAGSGPNRPWDRAFERGCPSPGLLGLMATCRAPCPASLQHRAGHSLTPHPTLCAQGCRRSGHWGLRAHTGSLAFTVT